MITRALAWLTVMSAPLAAAPPGAPGFEAGEVGSAMRIALLLAALSLLPVVVMAATPFLRITLVLHFLRQALGTQTAPSNQVLIGLALFLTSALMQPVITKVNEQAIEPWRRGEMTAVEAYQRGSAPVRDYMVPFLREKDVALILEISKTPAPKSARELPLGIVAPAYVLSELRTGFQIGVVLFLPFLVIDLLVASVTLTIGMVQLPPVMVSAPLKILLFVLVDGWNLVVGSLLRSFGGVNG